MIYFLSFLCRCRTLLAAFCFSWPTANLVNSLRFAETEADGIANCGGLFPSGGDATLHPHGFDAVGHKAKCSSCLDMPKCKWCPLSQTCISSGGVLSRCPQRADHAPADSQIVNRSDCETRTPPWIAAMKTDFGEDWESDESRYMDAVRCIQWAEGWPMSLDDDVKDPDEFARWSCNSALMRIGMLAMLDEKYLGNVSTAEDPQKDSVQLRPALCSLIHMKLKSKSFRAAGSKCGVNVYGLHEFAKARKLTPNFVLPGDVSVILRDSVLAGPLVTFTPGAGKSGSGFAMTADKRFKIKMGLKNNTEMHEPQVLFQMLRGNPATKAEALVDYLATNPGSILNRHYGVMRLSLGYTRSWITVLDDAFYGMDDLAEKQQKESDAKIVFTRYDLKGESRQQDKKRRGGYALINGDFKEREQGKVELSESQCIRLHQSVKKDVTFLAGHNIIDYSLLLLSVQRSESQGALSCTSTPGTPFCFERGDHLYTASLIDYLNNFNALKHVENIYNPGKFDRYASKLVNFAEQICPTADMVAFRNHLQALMDSLHGSARKAFDLIDGDGDGRISQQELKTFFSKDKHSSFFGEEQLTRVFAELEFRDADDLVDPLMFSRMLGNLGIAVAVT